MEFYSFYDSKNLCCASKMPHLKQVEISKSFMKIKYLILLKNVIQGLYFCHQHKFSIGKKFDLENIFSNVNILLREFLKKIK